MKPAHVFGPVLLVSLLCAGCGGTASPTTPTPSAATSPTTQVFASVVTAGGTATRFFAASQHGTVTITLESLGQPVAVGLGLGLALLNAGGCYLSTSVDTAAGSGAQIVTSVDEGNYCVKIYDVGNLTSPAAFSITIVAP